MKTYQGNEGTAPCILNLGTRWRWVVSFMPQQLYSWQKNVEPIQCKAGWTPEPV